MAFAYEDLFLQIVLLVSSNMHWLKEDACTLNVTSALLSSVVDVVVFLKRYSYNYCCIKTESESLTMF